jgi:protein gp37
MQKTGIVWPWSPLYTWNPVTGCRRGCFFCYARRIHERFNKTPFSQVTFHPKRIFEPLSAMKPRNIFVGSMTDIAYWEHDWKMDVIAVCSDCPGHTFIFLTKDARAYHGLKWPSNCILGLTITGLEQFQDKAIDHLIGTPSSRIFLSVEPLLGPVWLGYASSFCERIIVGAMTGPGTIKPRREWIENIRLDVSAEKLFWKESMKGLA